jgi:predicted permease
VKSHSGYTIYDEQGRSVDGSFSYPAYQVFRGTLPQFSDLVAFAENQFTVTADGTADLAFGHYVSGNYFAALGTRPLIGRSILSEDDAPGKPRVAVLTYLYWRRHFASDPSVVGRVILVNQTPVTVVGVMPPAFQGLLPGRVVDLFVPMSMVPETAPTYYSLAAPDYWWVQILGRLKPGVSAEAASKAVQAVLTRHIDSYAGAAPAGLDQTKIVLEPGGRGAGVLRGSVQSSVYILAAISTVVLLIACTNLANLLLARYRSRAREIAVRNSLGAGRWRLVRQILTENLMLAGMGATAGLLLAGPMLHLLLNFFSGTSVLGIDARIDARTLGFTAAVSIFTAVLFGALPAWSVTHAGMVSGLKESTTITAGGSSPFLMGRYLVSFQIALSLLLLVGAGLFLRTLMSLASVDLGFQTERILTFQTDPGRSGYKPVQEEDIYRRLEANISAIPGVEAVGMSHLPLIGGVGTTAAVRLPGDDEGKQTSFLYCSDSFLSAMRIPILFGRDLTQADFDRPMPNAIVNETFVKKYLPSANPVGQIFYRPSQTHDARPPEPFTIVGVARDAHYRGVRDQVPPTAYLPYAWRPPSDTRMVFMIRTQMDSASLASDVRQAVASVHENLPVAEMRTEREQVNRSLGAERLFAALVTAFGGIAIALAAIGLYGVMAFSVSRRTPEIGIRMALGAQPANVQWLVLRESLFVTLLGILAGVPSALMLTRLIGKFLYGVKPNDPLSISGAVVLMVGVAALAAWIPAHRASRVDPMAALRHE